MNPKPLWHLATGSVFTFCSDPNRLHYQIVNVWVDQGSCREYFHVECLSSGNVTTSHGYEDVEEVFGPPRNFPEIPDTIEHLLGVIGA